MDVQVILTLSLSLIESLGELDAIAQRASRIVRLICNLSCTLLECLLLDYQ